jgi:TPR repeat protein
MNELRVEQARQSTLMSVHQATIHRLREDIDRARLALSASPSSREMVDPAYDIGLDQPSPERERRAVDYYVAWVQAVALEQDLAEAETRYRDLETAANRRVASLEAELQTRLTQIERDSKFEIARLEEEIEQRDSSIVGLMHRLVALQSGAGSVPPVTAPSAQAAAVKASPEAAAVSRMQAATVPAPPADNTPAVEQNRAIAADAKPTVQPIASATTVADGVAAYQAGDYRTAYEIWRPLADANDARAAFYLGALYYEGRGVDRQLETAHRLLTQAVDGGHPRAAMLRERVAAEMTQAAMTPKSTLR